MGNFIKAVIISEMGLTGNLTINPLYKYEADAKFSRRE